MESFRLILINLIPSDSFVSQGFTMDELTVCLSRFMTLEVTAEMENTIQHEMTGQSESIQHLAPDPKARKATNVN